MHLMCLMRSDVFDAFYTRSAALNVNNQPKIDNGSTFRKLQLSNETTLPPAVDVKQISAIFNAFNAFQCVPMHSLRLGWVNS